MPILFLEVQYPPHKSKEVAATFMKTREKFTPPEGLFTTLVDNAVSGDFDGVRIFCAYLIKPGKYEQALDYLLKVITEFYVIEGYTYKFSTWSTLEEALRAIGQTPPK
jgi:hypothetical protein